MQIILTREEKRKIRRTIKKLKEALLCLSIVTVFIFIIGICEYIDSHYKVDAVVTKCDDWQSYEAEDIYGDYWTFSDDRKITPGTNVKLVIHNGFTFSTEEDDFIETVKVY